jgi:hypothetical protein
MSQENSTVDYGRFVNRIKIRHFSCSIEKILKIQVVIHQFVKNSGFFANFTYYCAVFESFYLLLSLCIDS